jgi:nitronate monooxygenase
MTSLLKTEYSWTSSPLIANAPMAGFAGARLATAVSLAGGLGFIGAAIDMSSLSTELSKSEKILTSTNISNENGTLPIGVGFLLFAAKIDDAIPVISKYQPAAIILSCPSTTHDFVIWVQALRVASPKSRIWIQLTNVALAIQVAKLCAPDVLVMQGADAGGHGGCPGAGIVSLVPETVDALKSAGLGKITVLAAGGVSDGRGVAAALACGADGVMLGTAFLATTEIDLPASEYQEAILEAVDGGVSTVRAIVFDELKGKNIWPSGYDGRALVSTSYNDFLDGVGIDELRKRHAEAAKVDDKGYGGERRAAIWAGSGVGLLKKVKSSGNLVRELREGAITSLRRASSIYE